MKNYFSGLWIFLLILFNQPNCLSQEYSYPYQGSIVAGSSQWFIISFINQPPVKARILSINGDRVFIQEKKDGPRYVERSMITNVEKVPYGKYGNVGFGYGIPYGGLLGVNGEFNILPYFAVTGALGTTIFAGFGYEVGAKAYFRKPGPLWRPRASLYYGINGIWMEDFGDPDNEHYAGLTAGLGQIFIWQRHGFDLDLMYIIDSKLYDAHPDNYVPIKIAIGYKYAF